MKGISYEDSPEECGTETYNGEIRTVQKKVPERKDAGDINLVAIETGQIYVLSLVVVESENTYVAPLIDVEVLETQM
uniref:Uncharacterized protein n=1 Tax=Solanum tuberosum TaxID=4113 RepID=M1DFP5_SOLTU